MIKMVAPVRKLLFLCLFFFCLNLGSAYCFDDSPASQNLLYREWTSANGQYRRSGTLDSIVEQGCRIRFDGRLQAVRRDRLSKRDVLFISALEFVDLNDPWAVADALKRISADFDYEEEAREILGRFGDVTTLEGESFSCRKLVQLDPRRAKFLVGKTTTRTIDLCKFDRRSKYLLLYNRFWDEAYRKDLKDLSARRSRASRNYKFVKKHDATNTNFVFPTGSTLTSKFSWGLEWSPPCTVGGEVTASGFFDDHSYYFGGWEHYDTRPLKQEIAEAKRLAQIAKNKQKKRAQYLASQRYYARSLPVLRYNGPVHVRGHYRNGSYVRPHTRSRP